MKCPFDTNCDGLTVIKEVEYCFSHDRILFDGRTWIPQESLKSIGEWTEADLRILINNIWDRIIIGCEAKTTRGAQYLLKNAILDMKLDNVHIIDLKVSYYVKEYENV